MDKLIIVEDEKWEREGLSEFIDWNSMDIRFMGAAASGREGLVLAKATGPDIILSDIRMPVMDGLEFTRQVKRLLPGCLVLLVTGYDDFSYAQDAIRHGVSDYLLKPVQKDQLVEAIRRLQQRLDVARREKESMLLLRSQVRENRDVQLVRQAMEMIHAEFETGIDLNTVSDRLELSANRLGTLFFQQTGTHFSEVLMQCRMERAEALLVHTGETLFEIAGKAGFSSASYFCTAFRKIHGVSPSVFRKRKGEEAHDHEV